MQHTATHCNTSGPSVTVYLAHGQTLQHTATHCHTLQHIATHCNTLHHQWPFGDGLLSLRYTAACPAARRRNYTRCCVRDGAHACRGCGGQRLCMGHQHFGAVRTATQMSTNLAPFTCARFWQSWWYLYACIYIYTYMHIYIHSHKRYMCTSLVSFVRACTVSAVAVVIIYT